MQCTNDGNQTEYHMELAKKQRKRRKKEHSLTLAHNVFNVAIHI